MTLDHHDDVPVSSAISASDSAVEVAADAIQAEEALASPPPPSPARAKASVELQEAVNRVQAPQTSSAPPVQPTARLPESEPRRSGGCLGGIGGVLLGTLLGVVLTLGFLLLLNQGLRYAPRTTVNSLQATVAAYEANSAALRGNLSALQDNVSAAQGNVDTLQQDVATLGNAQTGHAERLQEVSGAVDGLQQTMGAMSNTVEVMASDVATLTEQMAVVSVSASRAQRFMSGMQALLASVLADEPVAAASPVTATAVVTATPVFSVTLPLTATPAMTASLTITPDGRTSVTPTLAPTVTLPPLTATTAPTATLPITSPVLPAPASTPAGNAAIRGVVYLDADRTGTRSTQEKGLAGARVTLYTQNRAELAQTTSNAQGQYEFTGLASGIYIVVQNDLAGYTSSTPNVLTVIVRGNRAAENVNFGDYRR